METVKNDAIQVRIFQMPEETRSKAWISIQELREAGLAPDARKYRQVLKTQMKPEESMADLYDRLHYGRSQDGMRQLQVGDVIMFNRGEQLQSYYVDPFGFREVPEMTRDLLEHNRAIIQQQTHKRTGR